MNSKTALTRQSLSPAKEKPEGRKRFFGRLNENGCTIPTNPFNIDAREQSLKDTWTMFYQLCCCKAGFAYDGKKIHNQSSGNFPNYFPGPGIGRVRRAANDSLYDSGAYMEGVEGAREAIAPYYGVQPHHLFFCAGISDGIGMVHELFLNNTAGRVLIPNETYPTHLSTAMTFGGRNLVVTWERNPETRVPDFTVCTNGNNPFVHAGFSSFIPYDNPNPIVYPESFFRNDSGTGIFDLNERAFMKDGVIRPIVLDMIYQSFSWPERHVRIKRLIELSEEKNILVFLNSISKAFLEPNKKGGVLAVYVPDCLAGYAEGTIVRDLESNFQRRLGIIPNTSMRALVVAHEMLAEEDAGKEVPELAALRAKAKLRFTGRDGRGGNQALMCSVPYVRPMHPDIKIESSGYNLFYLDAENLPWKKPEYKKNVLGKLRTVLSGIEDENKRFRALSAFDSYVSNLPPERAAPSDIFCLDLVMETGVALVPAERFYKIGEAPDKVAFRPVMIAEPEEFRESMALLADFLEARIGKQGKSAESAKMAHRKNSALLDYSGC